MATLEQKIAQKESELARLKEQSRKLENGQKIITGGMVLSVARRDTQRAKMLLGDIEREVTKKTDLERMQPIIEELKAIINKANQSNQSQNNPAH